VKLLVVDDEPEHLASIDDILTTAGFRTLTAATVTDAIEFLESDDSIALVLADLIMPERSGLDLLDYMRSKPRYRKIPVIVCSGHARSEFVSKALRFGACDFIVKPITADVLVKKIRLALGSV
jgi:DNA-binding NtrC family response regulator